MNELTTAVLTRNRPQYLRLALQSLAAQKRKSDRVVVLDNGSVTETAEVLRSFAGVLPIEHSPSPRPLTAVENHNRAVDLAETTCYLHLLHDDDLILPEFYSTALNDLKQSTGKALFYCPCEFIDGAGQIIARDFPMAAGRMSPKKFLIDRVNFVHEICVPSIVMRTNYKKSHCAFSNEYQVAGDLVFWVDWASQCDDVFRTSRYLAHYRRHSQSESAELTKRAGQNLDERWRTIKHTELLLEQAFSHRMSWCERQRVKLIFSGWSQMTTVHSFAEETKEKERYIRKTLGPLFCFLGKVAVIVRKLVLPKR